MENYDSFKFNMPIPRVPEIKKLEPAKDLFYQLRAEYQGFKLNCKDDQLALMEFLTPIETIEVTHFGPTGADCLRIYGYDSQRESICLIFHYSQAMFKFRAINKIKDQEKKDVIFGFDTNSETK